jgi:hypothetical protein
MVFTCVMENNANPRSAEVTLNDIDDSEYQRGVTAAGNWWKVSITTTAVAMQRQDELDESAFAAFNAGDISRYSYLLGMLDVFCEKLS